MSVATSNLDLICYSLFTVCEFNKPRAKEALALEKPNHVYSTRPLSVLVKQVFLCF